MKGIILAGGKATRLRPLTKITSKQLLPVYNKPMVYYPIQTLAKAGIKDILVIVAPESSGQFLNLLGSGHELGVNLSYEVQDEPRGLPDAFIIGADFIGKDDVALILGDNIFDHDFSESIASFKSGGRIFAKEVPDPERYGVVEFDDDKKVVSIVEKPENPKSNYAVVGFYVFDNNVIEYAKGLKPSVRNELEIVDLHNKYLSEGKLDVNIIEGMWEDAGTFDSLLRVNNLVAEKVRQGEKI
jgi:glucose-1-phosphate thymidylyltransferase